MLAPCRAKTSLPPRSRRQNPVAIHGAPGPAFARGQVFQRDAPPAGGQRLSHLQDADDLAVLGTRDLPGRPAIRFVAHPAAPQLARPLPSLSWGETRCACPSASTTKVGA